MSSKQYIIGCPLLHSGWRRLVNAYKGEGLMWLIGAVVCLLAAATGPMSVSAGNG